MHFPLICLPADGMLLAMILLGLWFGSFWGGAALIRMLTDGELHDDNARTSPRR
jgi:hypothetical protein